MMLHKPSNEYMSQVSKYLSTNFNLKDSGAVTQLEQIILTRFTRKPLLQKIILFSQWKRLLNIPPPFAGYLVLDCQLTILKIILTTQQKTWFKHYMNRSKFPNLRLLSSFVFNLNAHLASLLVFKTLTMLKMIPITLASII